VSAPDNAPPSCPRRGDASSGPRRCVEEQCPLHLRTLARGRGRRAARWREDLQRELDDTCSLDVAERSRGQLTYDEIAVLSGCSRQAAESAVKNAIKKVRELLGVNSCVPSRR